MAGYQDAQCPWHSIREALEALKEGETTILKSMIGPMDVYCNPDVKKALVAFDVLRVQLDDGRAYVLKDHDPNPVYNNIEKVLANQSLAHLLEPKTPWIIGGTHNNKKRLPVEAPHPCIKMGITIAPYVEGSILNPESAQSPVHCSRILPLGLAVGDYDLQEGNIIISTDDAGVEQAVLIDVTHGTAGLPNLSFLGAAFGSVMIENPDIMLDLLTPHRKKKIPAGLDPIDVKMFQEDLQHFKHVDQAIMQETATAYAERITKQEELFRKNLGEEGFNKLQNRMDLVRQAIDDFHRPVNILKGRVFSFSTSSKTKIPPKGQKP